jgi:hypothetical protein
MSFPMPIHWYHSHVDPIWPDGTFKEPKNRVQGANSARLCAELVFVDLLRSPEIDSQPGGPVRQSYLSYRPAKLHRLAESVLRSFGIDSRDP